MYINKFINNLFLLIINTGSALPALSANRTTLLNGTSGEGKSNQIRYAFDRLKKVGDDFKGFVLFEYNKRKRLTDNNNNDVQMQQETQPPNIQNINFDKIPALNMSYSRAGVLEVKYFFIIYHL